MLNMFNKHLSIPAAYMAQDDIDPATLEVFKRVLESPSGKRWLDDYILRCVGRSHIIMRSELDGIQGYIKSYNGPFWSEPHIEIKIKPEDSWLKKWIKRQLM